MTLVHLGIALGFGAALFQAFNYAFAKDCAEKYSLRGLRQLIAAHIALGVPHAVPFFAWSLYEYASPGLLFDLLWAAVPYLAAQYLMIITLTLTDSSIVSPLLAFKVPVLALLSLIFYDQGFSLNQVLSVGAILLLGIYFSSISGRIRLLPLFLVSVISVLYALSNLGMAQFLRDWPTPDRVTAIAGLISYQFVFCALLGLPFLKIPRFRLGPGSVWQAKWVALAWTCSNLMYVSCLYLAGVVEASVAQSFRTVLGVLIAYLFYRRYIRDANTFRKKIAVAVLMLAAIVLYYL